MKTIDEIYQMVEESSHETAFNLGECEALYDTLRKLSKGANIIEVGVEYGRSTTVIAQMSKDLGYNFTAVDNWCQDNGVEAKAHVEDQIKKYEWPMKLMTSDSITAAANYKDEIDLVHIDGDHEYEPVLADIKAWLPKVKCGGFACFDDYGHDSLPGVFKACDEYMKSSAGKSWLFIGRFGNKLGIFQKI